MTERPVLSRELDSKTFRDYYYLKEELVRFCRDNKLPVSGGKEELTDRIARFLDTGEVVKAGAKAKKAVPVGDIALDTVIEDGFVCSQRHRAFFKEHLGDGFSFNVPFQKWLKANSGRTYGDAVKAYRQLLAEKKTTKTTIDRQFEYNAYIRDFFADNKGRSLKDAIKCWKYKKRLAGHNRYEKTDLTALD